MVIHPGRPLSSELRHCLAESGLSFLMTVARLRGEPSQRGLAGICAIRDHLLQVDCDLEQRPSLTPAAMAQAVSACDPDPEWKQRILRGMTLVAMFDGEPDSEVLSLLDAAAEAFGVDARPVKTYRNVMLDRQTIVRFDFAFPGATGGPPPPVFRHDCCHVLGGYGTTAAEEGGVVGFQAGFERLDPFDVIMFVMAEFELGIGVSPFIPGEWRQLDPDRVFAGLEHGSHVNTDLIRDIDPWDHFSDPLAVVRDRFAIPARGRSPEYPDPSPVTH